MKIEFLPIKLSRPHFYFVRNKSEALEKDAYNHTLTAGSKRKILFVILLFIVFFNNGIVVVEYLTNILTSLGVRAGEEAAFETVNDGIAQLSGSKIESLEGQIYFVGYSSMTD